MLAQRIIEKLGSAPIITTPEGQRLFFPFGPLRGYIIPKRAYEPIISKSIVWITVTAFCLLLAAAIASRGFDIDSYWTLPVCLLCQVIDYYRRTKKVTRKLAMLPRCLGMRVYARAIGPRDLWKRIISSGFMAALFATFAFLGPIHLFPAVCALWFTFWAVVNVRADYLRSTHNSDERTSDKPTNQSLHANLQ